MSTRAKVLFERGRFFIETGTAASFLGWLKSNSGPLWVIPNSLIMRMGHFIEVGDRDSATNLWMHICETIDTANIRLTWKIFSVIAHIIIASIAIYTLVYTIVH
jgi:hypothetical protein